MANKTTVSNAIKKANTVYGAGNRDFEEMIKAYSSAINTDYNRQREESAKAYDENYAKADNAALARGMGRSSYNTQTLANIDSEKMKAASDIYDKESSDILQYASTLQQVMKQYEIQQQQLQLERDKFDWQKEQAKGSGGRYRGTKDGKDDTGGDGTGLGGLGNSIDSVNRYYTAMDRMRALNQQKAAVQKPGAGSGAQQRRAIK